MKIALISYPRHEINAHTPSGIELFTYFLAQELARRPAVASIDIYGVGKNYFTSPKISFVSLLPGIADTYLAESNLLQSLNEPVGTLLTKLLINLENKAFSQLTQNTYDIIHNNSTSPLFSTLKGLLKAPVITTLHTKVNTAGIAIPYNLGLINSSDKYVAISNNQIKEAQKYEIQLSFVKTIYNGINCEEYSYKIDGDIKEQGVWLGRINPTDNKGLKDAIQVSSIAGVKLSIGGIITDQDWFDNQIKPILNGHDINLEIISFAEKNDHLASSKYLLYPLQWEEPFGLIFIESMACGTPVIAFARGSVPEIIKDGQTGFIVNSSDTDIRGDWIVKKTGIEGLAQAIQRISQMPPDEYRQMRENCRQHVEANFTIERMVDGYEKVYKQIIAK